MNCCTSIKDYGCIYSCDTIQMGISAPTTGDYTIEVQPDGVRVLTTANTAGQPLAFPGGYLNEDGVTIFKVIKPDGTYLEIDGSECFELDIRPTTNPALANTDTAPVECECEYDIQIQGVFQQTVTLTNCEDLTINIV